MPADPPPTDEPEPIALAIGREIRAARMGLGLSMRELAARIRTSQPFVSNLENGRIFPSLRTLALIAEALDVSPDRLLPAHEHVQRTDAAVGMRPRRTGEPPSRHLVGAGATMLNAYRVELAAGEAEPRPFAHEGEDFLLVLSGGVDLLREGVPALPLTAGESTRIEGRVPHRLTGGPSGAVVLIASAATDQHGERIRRP